MRKTPRTDNLLGITYGLHPDIAYRKLLDFTRRLELEIATLEKGIDDLHKSIHKSNY